MKKLFAAALCMGFFATACVVTDDTCECFYDDAPTCLNAVDLGYSCVDDCNWDVIDCDSECYLDGALGGYCGVGAYEDDCVCEY